MTNAPTSWDSLVQAATNDIEAGQEERENEEERPSVHELIASLPRRIREAMVADIMPTDIRILSDDIEWARGRISRLGGIQFATATRQVPEDETASGNVSGHVLDLPRAGELVRFRPSGRRGWSRPTQHAREHRNGQGDRNSSYLYLLANKPLQATKPRKERRKTDPELAAAWLKEQGFTRVSVDAGFRAWLRTQTFSASTTHPTGLPWAPTRLKQLFMSGRTTPGAGTKDGSGDYERVRSQEELDGQHVDVTPEIDLLVRFRKAHAPHASILDSAMTAQNMEEVAGTAGASSPHTGKRLLAQACEALRDFLAAEAFAVQNPPSRAA
jgi:hypothetical protein